MSKCSECTYLSPSDPDLYGRYWCETRLERVSACQKSCYRFCRDYDRLSSVSEGYEKYSNDNSGSPGCYLTTMMCYILKMSDTNYYINTMRQFRNNVLHKDIKYSELLAHYDIVGPIIANNLNNDPLKYQICANAFYKYIKPITKLIRQNKNNEAINSYKEMTNKLMSFYNINTYVDLEKINNIDLSKSGHGVYKTKKITL